jgi:hypothetical protein
VNAIAAAIISIVVTGIMFVAIIYAIYSNWITASAQNITTTPPTNYTTTTPTKTGINATTILNAVNNHTKSHNVTVTAMVGR